MELAYDRFSSIAKALTKRKSKSEAFTAEEMELFKKNRKALLHSAETSLSQMGARQEEGNTLLNGRLELAAYIKKELDKFSTSALEKQLLVPLRHEPQAQQPVVHAAKQCEHAGRAEQQWLCRGGLSCLLPASQ